jgi:anti-sigma regulatory factor (Ser/Thr protein kinase)
MSGKEIHPDVTGLPTQFDQRIESKSLSGAVDLARTAAGDNIVSETDTQKNAERDRPRQYTFSLPSEYMTQDMVPINEFWESVMSENGIPPAREDISHAAYQVFEFCKNASEWGGGGTLELVVDGSNIIVTITDPGPGLDPITAQERSAGGGYGLAEAILWADNITIESRGCTYTKQGDVLKYAGPSSVVQGTRIRIIIPAFK